MRLYHSARPIAEWRRGSATDAGGSVGAVDHARASSARRVGGGRLGHSGGMVNASVEEKILNVILELGPQVN